VPGAPPTPVHGDPCLVIADHTCPFPDLRW
jgi:hypothetical protein